MLLMNARMPVLPLVLFGFSGNPGEYMAAFEPGLRSVKIVLVPQISDFYFEVLGPILSIGTFITSWPRLSKQLQLLSPESFGGIPLPEYPF
jgi:hypothetical protein